MARIAAIFPNEGSHYVGMGKEFYDKSLTVRKFFDDAERLLEVKLAKLCFLGPKEEQDRLANAHLITFVNETAFFDLLIQKRRKPELLSGIGVGEVAALVHAEVLPYPNALQYIFRRTALLEAFAKRHGGASLMVSGVPLEKLRPSLSRGEGELTITHYLAPDVHVLWGPNEAIGALQAELQGLKDVKTGPQLPRGPLFTPAAAELEAPLDALLTECLEGLPLKNPKITFLRASDGSYVGTPEGVRTVLIGQYSSPVQWTKLIAEANLRGFRTWAEIGPGKVYSTLVKRTDKNNLVTNVENMNSLNTMAKVTG